MNRARSRRAFSLLEVVVAVAIFATTVSVLLAAVGNVYAAQSALSRLDDRHADRLEILRTLLSDSENDVDKLETGGDFRTLDGKSVRWRAFAEETPQAGLFRVVAEIEWPGDPEPETLPFFVFRPDWKAQFDNQEVLLENLREAFPSDRFDTY